jgi:mycothiol system anti-sigma-R factor
MSCGRPHETDCREVLDRLYEYLDGELTPIDTARIRQHLEECSPCLNEYGLEEAFRALLRRCCTCEPAPADLRARIMVQITQVRLQIDG